MAATSALGYKRKPVQSLRGAKIEGVRIDGHYVHLILDNGTTMQIHLNYLYDEQGMCFREFD